MFTEGASASRRQPNFEVFHNFTAQFDIVASERLDELQLLRHQDGLLLRLGKRFHLLPEAPVATYRGLLHFGIGFAGGTWIHFYRCFDHHVHQTKTHMRMNDEDEDGLTAHERSLDQNGFAVDFCFV